MNPTVTINRELETVCYSWLYPQETRRVIKVSLDGMGTKLEAFWTLPSGRVEPASLWDYEVRSLVKDSRQRLALSEIDF